MLIAEIHGKRCPEVENNEDFLTSAIFGHLRSIQPSTFWPVLFSRAFTIGPSATDLITTLGNRSVRLEEYTALEIAFWRYCGHFGEPDLLLRFEGSGLKTVIVLIEVKLHASKSNPAETDQLAKYLELLDNYDNLDQWAPQGDLSFLVYLTPKHAEDDLSESIKECRVPSAKDRMFTLQWQDVLEAASKCSLKSGDQLDEVATFLRRRNLEFFKGFGRSPLPSGGYSGTFYGSTYFMMARECLGLLDERIERFYE